MIIGFNNCPTPKKINLYLDGQDTNINIEDMLVYNNHYICAFTPSLDLDNFGTYGINFSKIDNPQLYITFENGEKGEVNIYAVNYTTLGSIGQPLCI